MDKRIRIAGIVAAIIFAIIIWASPNSPPIPEPMIASDNEFVQVLAINLEKPRAIDFAGDKIFVTEKIGRIRVIESGVLLEEPLATLRTVNAFDGGLLGIAVHPDFAENHFLYVYLTYENNGKLWNKILRITESENKLVEADIIFDNIPGSAFSNGGALKFGPDGKLYSSTGSVSDSSHGAQDLQSLEGKILRLNDDGTIPDDNPFSGSPVFSYGHMNPKGLAWDKSGNLFVSEIGPSKNDEINLVQPGKNYGWPEQECFGDKKFVDPLICYDPAIEPGGIVFYYGDKLELENFLIMAGLRGSGLFSLDIGDNEIKTKNILSGMGRIRDVIQGPDDYLYLITSNTDGKAFPDKDDDKLVRILK